MMSPMQGWSDAGSDTTEKIGEECAPIEYLNLINAAKHTEEFTRYLGALRKVNATETDSWES